MQEGNSSGQTTTCQSKIMIKAANSCVASGFGKNLLKKQTSINKQMKKQKALWAPGDIKAYKF